MIDFVSTRAGATPQDAACAHLLATVIVQAVRDASQPLRADEREQRKNMNPLARQALRFLFDAQSVFPAYARLIGSSAAAIRRGLLEGVDVEGSGRSPFPDENRRALQARFAFYE